jgi:N-acetyl sugar amidotransferase
MTEVSSQNLEAYYGLPKDVAYCKKCVISNQRPNSTVEFAHNKDSQKKTINFNEDGICDACSFADHKQKNISWDDREKELMELCDRHRKNDGSFDCLVPGSGGKDSFYTSHVLKYKYGMHPLTVTWAPHIYTDWGWKNFQAWIHSGMDNFLCTPNGRTHRLLTRLSVDNLFHPFQPFILGQKSLAAKMAILHNIPLVFYGENEAEYGNPLADNTSAKRDWKYATGSDPSKIHISGVSINELDKEYKISKNDLQFYMPADPQKLEKLNVEVHYLGYYLPWHPQGCYYYSVEHGGFQASPERTPGTYSKYNSIDDKIDDFHYYTTFIKFGIGRATYDASQEVRNGEINREEGVSLVKRFDGEFPERFAEEISQYLSVPEKEYSEVSKKFQDPVVDKNYFKTLAEKFRSPHLWKKEDGEWKLRHTVWQK